MGRMSCVSRVAHPEFREGHGEVANAWSRPPRPSRAERAALVDPWRERLSPLRRRNFRFDLDRFAALEAPGRAWNLGTPSMLTASGCGCPCRW